MNDILDLIVDDLESVEADAECPFRAVLLACLMDWPARSKYCGFLGHSAARYVATFVLFC